MLFKPSQVVCLCVERGVLTLHIPPALGLLICVTDHCVWCNCLEIIVETEILPGRSDL